MKKIIVAILAVLYMGVSSGVAMEIHYCMGKKAGVDFYNSKKDKCGKCGMKEKKGCCSDEHKFLKLQNSHKNVSNDINFSIDDVAVLTAYPTYSIAIISDITNDRINNNSPPDRTRPSLCILNCVFRL